MYIVLHICIYCTIVKKKKKILEVLPLGVGSLWDCTHPSLPLPQNRTVLERKKGGGGARSTLTVSTPYNRMMIFDHNLKGG